jgi:hypothetical protein
MSIDWQIMQNFFRCDWWETRLDQYLLVVEHHLFVSKSLHPNDECFLIGRTVFLMLVLWNNCSFVRNGIFLTIDAFFSSILWLSSEWWISKWNIIDFENKGPILSNRDSDRTKISSKNKHSSLLQLLTIISIVSKFKLLFKYKHLMLMHFLRIDFKLFWFSFELTSSEHIWQQ